jgi:hypothetical protein
MHSFIARLAISFTCYLVLWSNISYEIYSFTFAYILCLSRAGDPRKCVRVKQIGLIEGFIAFYCVGKLLMDGFCSNETLSLLHHKYYVN